MIEAKGDAILRKKHEDLGIIDEAQEKINELYRDLGKTLPYYRQSEPSVEKCVILEKEAEI